MRQLKTRLRNLLEAIVSEAGESFSGIGLIVYDDKSKLPVTNLRDDTPVLCGNLQRDLIKFSSLNSDFHDGFHLIDDGWNLTDVSQYFSPPMSKAVQLNRHKKIGGRYAAAQFGSGIDGVLMTGIATKGIGIAIFQDGYEILSEKLS